MKEYSINQIQDLMDKGSLTAKKLVSDFLKRIKKIDQKGPQLNSIIELNPDALKIAEKIDKERQQGKIRGPLHGIPVIIKDNISTADKMMTTAGSLALEGHQPKNDAFVVQKLQEADAIILAKANLSEWANMRSARSCSGWSSRGRQTKNPYILDRNPCGSSSGSAVAVAANLCTISIGTETDGSIICPAHVNSVVGIKPTLGLVSRTGIIPISHNQDTAGPIARTVADAALLLGAIAGPDSEDEITIKEERMPVDYTKFLDPKGLEGARIGVPQRYFGKSEHVDSIVNDTLKVMEQSGATIINPIQIEIPEDLSKDEFTVLLYDFKNDLNNYLEKYGEEISSKTMKDLIEYNKKNKEKVMPYFQQEAFELAQEKGPLSDDEYKEALQKCHEFRDYLEEFFVNNKLDAIVAASGTPAWPIDLINGDFYIFGSSRPAAVSGFPSITVSAGYVFGLPVGISFTSQAFQEGKLIKIAYAFEQASKIRKPPGFKPTLKLP
jgi:amidase